MRNTYNDSFLIISIVDGNPTLNLASFVHTWMPEEATKLIMETINKYDSDY